MRPHPSLTQILGGALALILLTGVQPARADWPVIDVSSIAKEVQQIASLKSIFGALGDNTFGTVQQLLQEGFTQNANYAKAQVGAQEQITDASNESMAQFDLQMRDADIRDQHVLNPEQCLSADGGDATQAAAIPAYLVGATIAHVQDLRSEGGPHMPSYQGVAQGDATANGEHIRLYCDQNDQDAGENCTYNQDTADQDQQFSTLFGNGTYTSQQAVTAAKDYTTTLIQPVAPAPLRGSQLTSVAGQDAQAWRRAYNARISAALTYLANLIGAQSPSVALTAQQQQYLQSTGQQPPAKASWLQVLQIESERRYTDLNWAAQLQAMPPPSVEREIATELALQNYLLFKIYQDNLQRGTLQATSLAVDVERNSGLPSPAPNPTPSP